MIHENGNYLMGYNRLKNEFHHEDAGQSFHMIKKEDCEIPPEIFRKILFLLMILTKACRQILGKYAVSVTMETASEKFLWYVSVVTIRRISIKMDRSFTPERIRNVTKILWI